MRENDKIFILKSYQLILVDNNYENNSMSILERRNRIRKEPPARPPPITTTTLSDEPVILRNPTNLSKYYCLVVLNVYK